MAMRLLLASLLFASPAFALKPTFHGTLLARDAEHLTTPSYPASQRLDLFAEQKLEFTNDANVVVSGRGFYENVYFARPQEYSGALRENDAREWWLQDAYAEYKVAGWSLRVGNQQVVWGETFGNPYSDLVNPKDLREGGGLDLAAIRRATPMGNLKYVADGFSAQALFLPRPEFNILPLPGSDYMPLTAPRYLFKELVYERERRAPENADPEFGGRLSLTFGNTDFSLLFMDYYDRNPFYELLPDTAAGGRLHVQERHARIRSGGMTIATELGGYVVRFEAIRNTNRQIPIVVNNDISVRTTDETIFTGMVDLPTFFRTNISVLLATSELALNYPYLLRKTREPQGGLRAQVNLFEQSSLEVQFQNSFAGQGNHTMAEFMTPLTSALEARVGVDMYGGPGDGQLGRLQRANRVYASVKAYFDGFKPAARAR